MPILPKPLENLIEELGRLPGVGPRTAERYAFFILKQDTKANQVLADSISSLNQNIKICPKTFMLIANNEHESSLYLDSARDRSLVAVVEDPLDVVALEKTGSYQGTYHIIGGVLSPIDGVGPEQLHIEELINRIKEDKVKEVILATNASIEGESTALYINKLLQKEFSNIKITRLARGLPAGVDLEYADQTTLTRAIEERQSI